MLTKKGRTANVEVKCFDCGKTTMSNNCVKRNIVLDGSACSSKTRNSSFICKSCYKIRRENLKKEKEKKHAWYRREKVEELMDSIEKFDDLMLNCEYNTCDILAAHRELLINDDNRLHTDFMLELISGEEKRKNIYKVGNKMEIQMKKCIFGNIIDCGHYVNKMTAKAVRI